METATTTNKEGSQVYELGFLVVPLVSEENLPKEVEVIKSAIQSNGGSFISEDAPKMRSLAYQMTKKLDAKNHRFNSAYFGWVKFETTPEEVLKIKIAMDENRNILRYLLIKTVRENTLLAGRVSTMKTGRGAQPEGQKTEGEEPVVSVEEMDKSIDKLVIQ